MRAQDSLFRPVFVCAWPLLVWAAHFFACYIYVAAACADAARPLLALSGIVLMLQAGALVLAIGAQGSRVRVMCAGLGLLGVLWTCTPMLMLPVCV